MVSPQCVVTAQRKIGEIYRQAFPLFEQVVLLSILPVDAGIVLAPAILFWEIRCVSHTVHAVRCACGGCASGANCIGVIRGRQFMLMQFPFPETAVDFLQ
jgi:hypothetical protein